MRELNECTAEVFRRSEKRIKERRRTRNRVLALCIPLCLIVTMWSVMFLPAMMPAGSNMSPNNQGQSVNGSSGTGDYNGTDGVTEVLEFGSLGSFTFSLTWNCYGISSYDSETGKLVKTTDASHPEDYITTYQLTDAQKQKIYDLILNLNVTSYPDTYNPQKDGLVSEPPMTLILSVKTDAIHKTIAAENIALTYKSEDSKGQRFLNVCKEIRDILIETEEWKALPEYEFFYD